MSNNANKSDLSKKSTARESLLRQRLRQRSREPASNDAGAAATSPPTGPVELSPFQRPLWVKYRMFPDHRTSWIIRGYLLDGGVAERQLADALERLGQRHWYLTCAIDAEGKVHPRDATIPLEVGKIDGDPWEAAKRFCRNDFEPFRLEEGNLFRVHVFEGKKETAVVVAIHHILADQSVDVLTSEMNALFEGDEANLAQAPNLVDIYEQQRSTLDKQRPALQDYWRNYLDSLPAVAPLPLARSRTDSVKGEGSLIRAAAHPKLAARCREAAANAGVSLYQWYLAAWTVLLARYYDRSDIHLGTMFSTRSGKQQKDALGCFQNVLILRAELESTRTFADVLAVSRAVIGNAIANGGLPLDELARLAPVHPGSGQLFSTLFTLLPTVPQSHMLSRNVLHDEELDYGGTAFDLTFFVMTSDDSLSFAIEFDTAVYDGEALTMLFDHYQALLECLATDVDTDWRQCSLVSPTELDSLRAESRRIAATPPPAERLHDAFYEHAAEQPDAIALQWDSGDTLQQVSYGELAKRADAIAGYIDSAAVNGESTVAVIGGWQPDTAAALIGILRSGRTYLPVDADYPAARIAHILNDAGRPLVLLQPGVPLEIRQSPQ